MAKLVDGTGTSFVFEDNTTSPTKPVKIGDELAIRTVSETPMYLTRFTTPNEYLRFTVQTNTKDLNFSVISPTQGDATTCNVSLLKTQCTSTPGCFGIIHSEQDDKWQMMTLTSAYSEGPVGASYNTHLRKMTDLSGNTNCPTGPVRQIPASEMRFSRGSDFSAVHTCPSVPAISVPVFDDYLSSLSKQWTSLTIPTTSDISMNIQNVNSAGTTVQSARADYTKTFGGIAARYEVSNEKDSTLSQRIEDSLVLDEHSRALAILWGIISVSVVSIILFRPN